MPSFHLEITSACLKSLCYFQYTKQANFNLEIFESYSEYGNPVNVRSQAIKSLILLSIQFLPHFEYLNRFVNLLKDPLEIPRLKYKVSSSRLILLFFIIIFYY